MVTALMRSCPWRGGFPPKDLMGLPVAFAATVTTPLLDFQGRVADIRSR